VGLEPTAEQAAAQREDGAGAGDGPRHAALLEAQPDGALAAGLDGLEVPAVDRTVAYECFDLGDDFGLERGGERRRFFSGPGASTGRASQIASLTSSNRSQVARKPRWVSTSRSIFESIGPGRSCSVLVLPSTLVVNA
jgi:hypothetical protein